MPRWSAIADQSPGMLAGLEGRRRAPPRLSLIRSRIPASSTSHAARRASSARIVRTMSAPWAGGFE